MFEMFLLFTAKLIGIEDNAINYDGDCFDSLPAGVDICLQHPNSRGTCWTGERGQEHHHQCSGWQQAE